MVHCRGKFQSVPISPGVSETPPPPRITVTTQNTTPTLFWGPLPLRHRPISISGASFSTTKTSRHRHRLQQTEECAAAPSPVAPPLFTGRRAASCVSPPRPRPTSPSSSRCGAAAWVHLSQTDGRNRCIIGMGEGENCSLQTESRREGEGAAIVACTCHRIAIRHRIWLLLHRLSIALDDGECVRERAWGDK